MVHDRAVRGARWEQGVMGETEREAEVRQILDQLFALAGGPDAGVDAAIQRRREVLAQRRVPNYTPEMPTNPLAVVNA